MTTAPHCTITTEPLDARALESAVAGPEDGAVATFIGQVRNHARGRSTAYLEYRAYEPMALKQLLRIAEEAQQRWPVKVAVAHRLGRLEIGEASVIVSAASPHRNDAFEACRYVIDSLKQEVPIWKKEVGPDGSFWIEGDNAVEVEP